MTPLRLLRAVDRLDRRLLHRLTRRRRHSLESNLTRLTHSANRSLLWLVLAEIIAATRGRIGRRAALRGVVAIMLTSAFVNGPLKVVARRQRPDPRLHDRPPPLKVPGTFSFPSGHAASAFAFTTAVGLEDPRLYPLLLPVAAGVAYSRVHLRVHYPFDVVAGAAIGTTVGIASDILVRVAREWRDSHSAAPPEDRPRSRQLILVTSPHAGSSAKLGRAVRAIRREGLEIVHQLDVAELARLPELLQRHGSPAPLVVAAGGDGTGGAVADQLVGTEVTLGILPLGTSNDFARSLEIPMRPEYAARLLRRGRVSPVDVGRLTRQGVRPRHFVHAATVGLNVNFARLATRADLRRRLGRLTYAVAAVRAFRERSPWDCAIEYEGRVERLTLIQLSAVNTPVFGGALGLQVPGADPLDRTLDILLVENLPFRRFLRSLFYPVFGITRVIHGIRWIKVRRLTLRPDAPMEIALDGEVCGTVPGTVDVVPRGLQVVTPAAFAELHHP
ncbi:MAG TPA: YegS/Rv2252/BmrU family lipid kinase [Candidatus Limnocylindrales bacterium]|nr:YegS/Rv2252/BmrU family lipid kinase [Candidatus Limnocylindrales bacterium]